LQLFSAINRRPLNACNFVTRFYRRIFFREIRAQTLPTWVPDWSDNGNTATPLSLMLAQSDTPGTEHGGNYQSGSYQPMSVGFRCHEKYRCG